MNDEFDEWGNPSNAALLRLDLRLLDCPGQLTEMRGRVGDGVRQPSFTVEDDLAVRRFLGRTIEQSTFAGEIEQFAALRDRYGILISGFGTFTLKKNLGHLFEEVANFNDRLVKLRSRVSKLLEDRYGHTIEGHKKILRFNPRVKLGVYILPMAFVRDEQFQRAVGKIADWKFGTSMTALLGISETWNQKGVA